MCALVLFLLSPFGVLSAFCQEVETPVVEKLDPEAAAAKARAEVKAKVELEKIQAEALVELLEGTTELTVEQRANFEKWLPHTFKRLQKRLPVHIAAIGDSVTRYMSYDEDRENSHKSYHGHFAAHLADEFFYTGGVRDIVPEKAKWSKREPVIGDEITLENLGMNGRVSLHALARITADGLVNNPDLVLINFGINDALLELGLATYSEALELSVRYVKSTGADVILLGPSNTLRDGNISDIAFTRPYSGAMREVAAKLDVFYFDLSSVTLKAPGTLAGTEVGAARQSIGAHYRSAYFDHDAENNDGVHPNPSAHLQMGDAIFRALRDGTPEEPYRIKGFVTLGSGGKAVLEFKMKNLTENDTEGQLLLLPIAGMLPAIEAVTFELAAGKAQVYKVAYQTRDGASFDFPADAPRVFVPVIVTDTARSYSPVFAAAITPVGVVWDVGSENVRGAAFAVNCDLVATGAAAASGTYSAAWNGQKEAGEFSVQPGAKQSLGLKFNASAASGDFSVRDELVLTLDVGGQVLRFVRTLEASRNIGLDEVVPMINPVRYLKGEASADGRVNFIAQASIKNLVLNFDVDNIPLQGDEQITPLILEFQLDARPFKKRHKFGYVDIVRVKFGVDGQPERMSELRVSVFGDWYNRELNKEELTAKRTQLPNGRTRYSVAIPRSYLYLHEYALGKNESTFGINAELFFARTGRPTNPYPPELHFTLVKSDLNKYSPESLTVLELARKSSGGWSVRLK